MFLSESLKSIYYQINLYSKNGERLEVYTRSFSTDDMEDTITPQFVESNIKSIILDPPIVLYEILRQRKGAYGK